MIKTAISLSFVIALAGCSVWGGNTFQCPGNSVDGATCMSARQLYEATHVTDNVAPNFRDGKPIDPSEKQMSAQGTTAVANAGTQSLLNTYLPPLPDADSPLPVRTPAKVMRIRIFPWEDNQRDLNTGGFVFTEVEGRAWTLGDDQVSRVQPNVITPLAMPKGAVQQSQFTSPLTMPQGRSNTGLPSQQSPGPQSGFDPSTPRAPQGQPGSRPTKLRTP
jgi:conjugal transfer pilus assembly protein TraV